MQLRLLFHAPGLRFPLSYRQYVQGMIYNALRIDASYSAALHDGGSVIDGRTFKLFTFGQLEGPYIIREKQIVFSGSVSLEIRSIHDDLMLRLFRAFSGKTAVVLGKQEIAVKQCSLENVCITDHEILICTRSPIVAYITKEDKKTVFYTPKDPAFYSLAAANARRKWRSAVDASSDPSFQIRPADHARFDKQVTVFKHTWITAWSGSFYLQGDPVLLNLLYQTGLGAKNSQGFGMFSVLK